MSLDASIPLLQVTITQGGLVFAEERAERKGSSAVYKLRNQRASNLGYQISSRVKVRKDFH